MFLLRNGWMEAGMAPGDKADKWKMQLQIYLIENVLGSLSWATAQASHIHMRRRKGGAVHAWQTICCHHYTPVSFLHILNVNYVGGGLMSRAVQPGNIIEVSICWHILLGRLQQLHNWFQYNLRHFYWQKQLTAGHFLNRSTLLHCSLSILPYKGKVQ